MNPTFTGTSTWWGNEWIGALELLGDEWPNRLPRGRGYAQAGRVQDLVIRPGIVAARVAGSRARPYRVQLTPTLYTEEQWEKLVQVLAGQAGIAVSLLQGEMPDSLPRLLSIHDLPLFPRSTSDFPATCSCPDWANPCKHVAAVLYVLGAAIDRDPFLLFELRGRTRQQLLSALSQARSAASQQLVPAASPQAEQSPTAGTDMTAIPPDAFWGEDGPLPSLTFTVAKPATDMPVLKRLGAPPSWRNPRTFEQAFRPLYEDAAELALAITQGECREISALPTGSTRPAQAAAIPSLSEEQLPGPAPEQLSPEQQAPAAQPPAPAPHPVPKLAAVCQALLTIVADAGYLRLADADQLDSADCKLFRIALEALIAEGVLQREGYGRNTRFVPTDM
jgi:uncharacterized Zn finger protein